MRTGGNKRVYTPLPPQTGGLLLIFLGFALSAVVVIVSGWPEGARNYGHLLMLAIFVPLLFGAVALVGVMDNSSHLRNRTIIASARAWVIVVLLVVGSMALEGLFQSLLGQLSPPTNLVFWLGFIVLICGASLLSMDRLLGLHVVGAAAALIATSIVFGIARLSGQVALLAGALAVAGAFLVAGLALAARGD